VWITEQGSNKLGRWDPKSKEIVEYQDSARKHTVRVDPKTGMVWSTGALSVFDPKTEKFTHIPEVPTAYGIALDPQNNVWVTEMTKTGFLDKIDPVTLKVTKYIPPSRDRPRRLQVDADGIVWLCVFEDGKIDRFDPKTETFKEFPLPNARSLALVLVGIARRHRPARSRHRQGHGISHALCRQRHARLLPR
jgi:streptogramin lyase